MKNVDIVYICFCQSLVFIYFLESNFSLSNTFPLFGIPPHFKKMFASLPSCQILASPIHPLTNGARKLINYHLATFSNAKWSQSKNVYPLIFYLPSLAKLSFPPIFLKRQEAMISDDTVKEFEKKKISTNYVLRNLAPTEL